MKRVLIALIRFYQKNISSRTAPCCRFTPTCSQYAITAIERFGAIRGSFMAMWRILRCAPWSAGGYDPVPEKKEKEKCCRKHRENEIESNIKCADNTSINLSGSENIIDVSTDLKTDLSE